MFVLKVNKDLIAACGDYGMASILHIVQKVMGIIQIIVPIVMIFGVIWMLTKMMLNPEEKKYMKMLRNSVFAGVIVIFIPFLVNLTMGFLDDSFDVTACWKVAKATDNLVNWNDADSTDSSGKKNVLDQGEITGGGSSSENSSGRLTGVEALITCGDYYNKKLEAAVKKGEKWVYSNSSKYVKQKGTFEDMLKYHTGIRGGNCASIANWAFRDMGIISKNQGFYGNSKGKIQHYHTDVTKVKERIDKACNVINGHGKSFSSLVDAGKIKAGDVILGKGHTFIYRGGSKVYASGHDGKWHKDPSVRTDDSNKAVFEKWIRNYKGTSNARFKVRYIIRIKDSYVPKYYRDKNGKLIKNK